MTCEPTDKGHPFGKTLDFGNPEAAARGRRVGVESGPFPGPSVPRESAVGRSVNTFSHPPQPSNKVASVNQQATAAGRCQRARKHLRESPALQIEVGASVAHGGVESSVTEPLADGGEVDAGF
jgi:hypothetical protein